MKKRALTTGEVAEYLSVNFRTVIRWIERGHLKAYQLPGRGDNRVTVEDFLGFLQANKMPIPEEFKSSKSNNERRVLVVEDEKPMANAIERVLRQSDFDVRVANDGFTAGAQFSLFEPAVATLDLQIPGLGGMDVLHFVRSTERLEGTKILVVSAMPQQQLEAAVAAGADGYLQKPFDNDELLARVRELAGVSD
jgi:two-component system response regulator VicR